MNDTPIEENKSSAHSTPTITEFDRRKKHVRFAAEVSHPSKRKTSFRKNNLVTKKNNSRRRASRGHYRRIMCHAFQMMCDSKPDRERVTNLLLEAARGGSCMPSRSSSKTRIQLELHALDVCIQGVCASENVKDDPTMFRLSVTLCYRILGALRECGATTDSSRLDHANMCRRLSTNLGRLMAHAGFYEQAASWHCLSLDILEREGAGSEIGAAYALEASSVLYASAEKAAEEQRHDNARDAALQCLNIAQNRKYAAVSGRLGSVSRVIVSASLIVADYHERLAERTNDTGELWNALSKLLLCLSQFRSGVVPPEGLSFDSLRGIVFRVKNILRIIENEMGDTFEHVGLYPSLVMEARQAVSRFTR